MVAAFASFLRLLLRGRAGRAWGLAVLGLVSSLSAGAGLALLLPLLEAVGVSTGSGAVAARIGEAFRLLGLTPSLETVLAVFLALAGFQGAIQRTQTVQSVRLAEDFSRELHERLFRALAEARWEALLAGRSSDVLHAALVDVRRAAQAGRLAVQVQASLLLLAVQLALAGVLAPGPTALGAVSGTLLLALLRRSGGRTYEAGRQLGERWRRGTHELETFVAGFKIARCFDATAVQQRHLAQAAEEVGRLQTEAAEHQATGEFAFRFASAALLCGLVLLSIRTFGVGPAELLVLLFVFSRVVPLFSQIEQFLTRILADLPAVVHLEALMRRLEAEREPPSGPPSAALPLREELRLEGVTYRYPGGGGRGVERLGIRVPAGRITALVGPSGAGKTTVADLVMGLLTPEAGTLRVDGRPLTAEDRANWRAGIGYVAQEPWLRHDSIRANLQWVRPDAPEDALWRALAQADAEVFVRALPEGLDTVVGDRGCRLSGGERQRLALARAFLREPTLLVLDEPTSSLDEEAEDRILQVLEGLRGRLTVLLVTHRGRCAARADAVVRLGEGRTAPPPTADPSRG